MTDQTVAQQHAIAHQLQAVSLGALYGAVALAGLIFAHVMLSDHVGAALAIVAAFCAYMNFTCVAAGARGGLINLFMGLSIIAGGASAVSLALGGV